MFFKFFTLFAFICLYIEFCYTQDAAGDDAVSIKTIILDDGYAAEEYEVTTKDGYILSLYRIPSQKQPSKVVYLMHGMAMSAVDFLVLGPHQNKALAYTLSDAGYDVWIGNARGTKFSKKHSAITTNDDEYWQFSWDEIGRYDIPAFIDHILAKTGQKSLHFVGHSQGCTSFFVMLSVLPAYNDKIRTFHGMAPVMIIKNPCPLCQFFAANANEIEEALSMFNIVEVPMGGPEVHNAATMFCKEENPFSHLCANVLFALIGKSPQQFNGTLLGQILKNVPAGLSFRQFYHFLQLVNSKKFQMYDYKSQGNLMKYNSTVPPEYQTSNIRVKMQILYGSSDLLATTEDVDNLIRNHHQQVVDVVKLDGWNHIDLLYGKDANKMVYQKIIEVMRKNEM